jgi:cystathionine gamma-synthase/methionine-gamma-lyase
MSGSGQHFETRAVHSGERQGEDSGGSPISTPIHTSTTFFHTSMQQTDRVLGGEEEGYSYSRHANPTVVAFEDAMASLEGSNSAFAFSSGMAALHAAITACEPYGGTVLAAEQLYGSTATLLLQLFAPAGVEVRFVDAYDLKAVEEAVGEHSPRALIVESISNPLLRVADVPAVAEAAGPTPLIVDATLATPCLQRPFEMGADIVVHSATKYLSGHGDLTAGVVATNPPYDAPVGQPRVKGAGDTPGPFDARLAHRGLKTLPLRMEKQCDNAASLAERLQGHPKIEKVHYPGLGGHPDHDLAGKMLHRPGGLLSFELSGAGREESFRFLEGLELCVSVPSLGDIYTLAIHPASSSHRELPPSRRQQLGVGENLVRISCGIENAADVIEDVERALKRL